ncbi:MAG TPA: methyltransferase domain-containing protein [Roseiflexaceae bacterium]|nr:methyltransferase domain-containing protein [Roseiflexaceae bacterium]HMP42824.1 methyltransferase domain-containing protein [Roseiflexaceae bacterium]
MPQLLDYPRYALQLLSGKRSAGEHAQYRRLSQDVAPHLDLNQPRDILDLANGRLRPQYAIMRNAGHRVTGIDFANRPQLSRVDLAYMVARRIYAWRLGIAAAAMHADRLLVADVGRLPLPDASIDLVISAAAFEHFLDVPAVLAELARVLRPGGMVWTSIHLFTSLSGGHNLSFAESPLRHLPPGVDAWDHLRRRRLPFSVPLNQWRAEQYLAAFARHFAILSHYCAGREGEEFLTPEIAAELADFSRDELTCGSYVIVARRS